MTLPTVSVLHVAESRRDERTAQRFAARVFLERRRRDLAQTDLFFDDLPFVVLHPLDRSFHRVVLQQRAPIVGSPFLHAVV